MFWVSKWWQEASGGHGRKHIPNAPRGESLGKAESPVEECVVP